MTVFDLIAVLVVALSVGFSIWRGLVREVLALLSWILAFWLAKLFAAVVAGWLPASWSHQGLRIAIGFVAVMLVSIVVLSLVSMLVVHLVKVAGLTASDRALGAVFGLLRGLLIVVALVLLGGMTSEPREAYWRNALFSRPLERMASWAKSWLPEDIARRVSFE
ncbi:MAG TPA: CvpA family protein [Burkholderiales bacterium]|nr:CvpA family protein [Burkholderiales bacterium]